MMKPLYAVLIAVFGIVLSGSPGLGSALQVAYIEYPPYYYSRDGHPGGFLIALCDRIFAEADIPVDYLSMPAKRILYYVRESRTPFVSIGWFKTPERTAYAKYTRPIYRNRPLVLVTLKENLKAVGQYSTLWQVLTESGLSMGRLQGYSNGEMVDAMIARAGPEIVTAVGTKVQLMRMLNAGRFSYMLLAPEEVDSICADAGVDRDAVAAMPLADMPKGNTRYIICSRSTPDHVIERLNRAILKIVGESP